MIQQAFEGIVLRKIPYTSSSAIVHVYTHDHGPMAIMVRGLGKKKSKSVNVQPLSVVEFECYYKPSKEVQTISNLDLAINHLPILTDPYKTTVCIFLAELLSKVLREEAPEPELYHFLRDGISHFSAHPFSPDFHLIFLGRLSSYLGFYPDLSARPGQTDFDLEHGHFTDHLGQSIHTLNETRSMALRKVFEAGLLSESLGLSQLNRRQALNDMMMYYQLHLDGMGKVKSLDVLEEVFS